LGEQILMQVKAAGATCCHGLGQDQHHQGSIAMTSKILCPTDGSDHATVGVHLAVEVAKATGGHLTLCVVNIAHGGARGPTINHLTDEEAQQLMSGAEALAKADGLTDVGTVEIVAREAAPAITAYAEQNGYTHIVMGTGDKKGLKRLVLGSVAAEVVSHAHCTVTVAR
jgi:nucleotide-binding universal stress UspA family protein